MITVTRSPADVPVCRIRADKRFVKQYRDVKENAGDNFESNVEAKIDRICANPLDGTRKTGRLSGIRGLHIEHLVALWEVTPDIASREYADSVEELYFVGIVHHDDYHRSIVNRQLAEPHRQFTVVMKGGDTSQRHLVYEVDGVTVEDETWFNKSGTDGVVVHGTYEEGRADAFDSQLPPGVGVSTAVRVAEGVDIGVKWRRIIGEQVEKTTPTAGETTA